MTLRTRTCARARRGLVVLAAALVPALGLLSAAALPSGDAPTAAPASANPSATRSERPARVVGEERIGPRLLDLTIRSPALAGTGKVRLLTPDGWESRRPGDRWPTLYLLPDGSGNYRDYTDEYHIEDWPELRRTLVVVPQMPFYGFYSDWWNDGAGGAPAVETFHLDEVLTILEHDYGAGRQRSVAGQSQGGYGAVKYAARRPGTFKAVASFGGFLHPLQYPEAVSGGAEYLKVPWRRIWGDPVRQRHVWQQNDPYHLAERLRGTRVHIAAGDGTPGALDPPGTEPDPDIPGLADLAPLYPDEVISLTEAVMGDESRTVARRLQEAGVHVTTHFYRGTHSPPYWERELRRVLPMLLNP
ncbi:alpha/beta hydrolase-fold protein [Streptomyces sp. HB2AG]|nr:alpha/beta hydrolase-fold protein [Streptomyces sp. HB2AG]MCZ2524103.1 alpha/beta hydrolase-fold protein [Streptomyces sp. HB2AG]